MTRRLNALMYHDVVATGAEDSSGFPGRDAALYKVTPQQFALHLDAIERAVGDRPDPRGGRSQGAPAITFDDGGVSALAAAELLEARGWIGHFFIAANYIGRGGFVRGGEFLWVCKAGLRQRGRSSRARAARPRDRQPFVFPSAPDGPLLVGAAGR